MSGPRTSQRKFTDEEILEMRKMRADTPITIIATCFGASISTVHDIVRGKTYKDVGGKTYKSTYAHRVIWAGPKKGLCTKFS